MGLNEQGSEVLDNLNFGEGLNFGEETNVGVKDIIDKSDNLKVTNLIDISANLGLKETPEMEDLRNEIVVMILSGESYKHKNIEYEELALGIIDKYRGEKFAKAQIALSLLKASIYLQAGNTEYYSEDIADILDYCKGMGYEDITEVLEKL